MRGNTISIELPLKRGKVSKTIPLYQYDYGQKLIITGAELPEYYEVHFSNEMHGDAVTSIGDSTGVLIPDALLATGENVYLWLYLHADSDDGETEFQGAIPVIKRAQVTDQTPTPAEQSVITQAIAALTAASAEATEAKEGAEAAQQHIENMGVAATTLPTDSDATVTKTVNSSGEVTLTFGLPRGVKGDRGDRGLQGETGNAGEDGADGFSPVVSLTKSGKVTTFSVTDAEDTYSVEINDGEDGNPGQDATPDLITVDYSDLTFPVVAGTMCYHSGLLYKANQAIATSEEWTAAHWTQTTIEEEHLSLKTEINSKADIVIDTVSGSVAHITDGIEDAPVQGLKITIVPTQAGSGTPSINNFRNPNGYTGVILSQSGIDVNNPTTKSISWQTEAGTVYYGTYDLLTGVLIVTHRAFWLAFNDMNLDEDYPGWKNVSGLRECYNDFNGYANLTICNIFVPHTSSDNVRVEARNANNNVWIPKSKLNVSGQTEAKSVYANKDFVFVSPLLQPKTYQLAPVTDIQTLAGENNFWVNTGETTVTYFCDTTGFIEKKAKETVTPEGTSFFEGIDFFDVSKAEYIQGKYINSSGVITESATSNSIIIPVEPNTTYWMYIPNANRAYIGTEMTNAFETGTTHTLVKDESINNAPFSFTTGNVAHFAFIYFYSGGVYDYAGNKTRITLNKGTYNPYKRVFLGNKYLPDGAKNVLTDAKILIFGDSITSCCDLTINGDDETTAYAWRNPSNSYEDGQGHTVNYSMWAKILKESQPCGEIRNYAYPGAEYKTASRSSGNERQNLHYQIDVALNDLDNPNGVFSVANYVPDIVIFTLGTNDDNPNDTYDSAMAKTVLKSDGYSIDVDATIANLDETKFCESARKAYLRIKSAFPMAQIYVVLPIQRSYDELAFGNLHTYLKQIAERYGAVMIDGAGNSGITRDFNIRQNLGLYLKDGLHPNEKGQNLLARLIISTLKANYMPFGYGFNQ